CASQVAITNTRVSAGRRNGISIVSGIGVTLDSNVIQGAGNQTLLAGASVADTGPWAGIDVEPDLSFMPIKDVTVTRNTISNNGYGLCTTDSPLRMQVTLSGNTVSGNSSGDYLTFQQV